MNGIKKTKESNLNWIFLTSAFVMGLVALTFIITALTFNPNSSKTDYYMNVHGEIYEETGNVFLINAHHEATQIKEEDIDYKRLTMEDGKKHPIYYQKFNEKTLEYKREYMGMFYIYTIKEKGKISQSFYIEVSQIPRKFKIDIRK